MRLMLLDIGPWVRVTPTMQELYAHFPQIIGEIYTKLVTKYLLILFCCRREWWKRVESSDWGESWSTAQDCQSCQGEEGQACWCWNELDWYSDKASIKAGGALNIQCWFHLQYSKISFALFQKCPFTIFQDFLAIFQEFDHFLPLFQDFGFAIFQNRQVKHGKCILQFF